MLGLEWWVVVSGIIALTIVAAFAGPGVFMYMWRRTGGAVLRGIEEEMETKIKLAVIQGYKLRLKHEKAVNTEEDDDDDYH